MIIDSAIMWGLLIAGAVWLFHSATTRQHQPQIMQIQVLPDPSQQGGGCLPILLGLALLILFLAGGK